MTPPKHLSPSAKAAWRELLRRIPTPLEDADYPVFEMCAVALADYRRACAILNEEGFTIEHRDGRISQHPAQRVRHDAAEMLKEGSKRFGWAPYDRLKIQRWQPPKKEEPGPNSILRFLTPGGKTPANVTPFDPLEWDKQHPEDFPADEEEETEDAANEG